MMDNNKSTDLIASLGKMIREERKAKKLSQTELATKTNFNQKTISALENGSPGIEARTIFQVFRELDLSFEILNRDTRKVIYSSEKTSAKNYQLDRSEVLSALNRLSRQLKKMGLRTLILFGSTARGEALPKSDIDIAYEFNEIPDIFTIGQLENMLQNIFNRKIDLVRLSQMKESVRKSAEKDMIRVI